MDRQKFADVVARRMFVAYNDYCSTGDDKPSWIEWAEKIESVLAKRPQRTILSLSIQAIGD